MKKIIYVLCFISTINIVTAQTGFKRNDLYIEAGGNGLFGSVNYERQLTQQPGMGIRIGIGFYSENAFYLTLPVGINYLFPLKNKKSFIDAGLGMTFARIDAKLFKNSDDSNGDHFVNIVPSIGYRRHTAHDMMWRISITPGANRYDLIPWLGFSIGKRF